LAGVINLGNDEVYYLLYARYPDINFFDHPPLVGYAIRVFTGNFFLEHEIFYRLPGIIGAAVATVFIYLSTKLVMNEDAAWFAAILYTTSIYCSLIAGTFILPDSIQLVCWMAAVYYAIILCKKEQADKSRKYYWVLFGLFSGLAIYSKLHGVFLWIGMFGFSLFHRRENFREPWPWLSLAISLSFLIPVLQWNIANDFITYRFHGSRVSYNGTISFFRVVREWLGEIAYHNPANWIIICSSIIFIKRNGASSDIKALLLWFSIPIVFILWILALFRDTLPHWSGPGYTTLIIIAACHMAYTKQRWFTKAIKSSIGLIGFLVVAGMMLIYFFPGTFGSKDPLKYGSGDFTLDMYGWKKTGKTISNYFIAKKYNKFAILSPQWFPAAHIDEYIAKPAGMKVFGAGPLNQVHHYQWFNKERGGIPNVDSFIYICPSNYYKDPTSIYRNYFSSIRLDSTFIEMRNGKPTRKFYVYFLSGVDKIIPEPIDFIDR
jgi:hypothetical protein